jgi:hypothetical protein
MKYIAHCKSTALEKYSQSMKAVESTPLQIYLPMNFIKKCDEDFKIRSQKVKVGDKA